MVYQKVMLCVLYFALGLAAINALYPSLISVPDHVLWVLFIATSAAIAFVNIVLGFADKGWIEKETDPVPFRSAYRAFRDWRRK
jgi:hypothetical protein